MKRERNKLARTRQILVDLDHVVSIHSGRDNLTGVAVTVVGWWERVRVRGATACWCPWLEMTRNHGGAVVSRLSCLNYLSNFGALLDNSS
jgi:hypothetical protein